MERTLAPPDLEEDIDTVAGLVSALAGRVPQRGEVIAHPDGFDFEITDADPRRVKRVRVRPHPPAVAAEAETPAPSKPDGQ
jgi:CBS domain containing-hemolysin-like protein